MSYILAVLVVTGHWCSFNVYKNCAGLLPIVDHKTTVSVYTNFVAADAYATMTRMIMHK